MRRKLVLWLFSIGLLVAAPDSPQSPMQTVVVLSEDYLAAQITAESAYASLFRLSENAYAAGYFAGMRDRDQFYMDVLQSGKPK